MDLAASSSPDPFRPKTPPPSGVRRCWEGEAFSETAFRAFVSVQYERAQVWARALNVTRHDAEDITQEALLRLWQNRAAIERSGWPGWLWTAMFFRGRKHHRSRRRTQEYEAAFALYLQEEIPSASPEVAMQMRQCERELLHRIALLRHEQREVVRLYLLEELPMEEVATHLGISVNTAHTRWRLAQASMRAAFTRDRAKERFKVVLAALAAFFVAAWSRMASRIVGRAHGRAGPILACAALALVVARHDDPAEARESDETAIVLPSAFEYRFAPKLTAYAEREREATSNPTDPQDPEAARILLAQASVALQRGNLAIVRSCLAQYRAAYPVDPTPRLARRHAALTAALASH